MCNNPTAVNSESLRLIVHRGHGCNISRSRLGRSLAWGLSAFRWPQTSHYCHCILWGLGGVLGHVAALSLCRRVTSATIRPARLATLPGPSFPMPDTTGTAFQAAEATAAWRGSRSPSHLRPAATNTDPRACPTRLAPAPPSSLARGGAPCAPPRGPRPSRPIHSARREETPFSAPSRRPRPTRSTIPTSVLRSPCGAARVQPGMSAGLNQNSRESTRKARRTGSHAGVSAAPLRHGQLLGGEPRLTWRHAPRMGARLRVQGLAAGHGSPGSRSIWLPT